MNEPLRKRPPLQTLVCAFLCAALAWSSVAHAQLQAEPPEYRSAIESAVAEYELGNFAEARSQFQRAHELYPNARSWRGMGMTEFELRNYPEALAHLERSLAEPIKPLPSGLRKETERLLEKTRGYVARLTLRCAPADASVTLDGVPLEPKATDVLLLAVGDHVLEFHAPGHHPQKRSIKVTGGEQPTLHVVLASHASQRASRRWYKNPWLWSAVGVVAAGSAAVVAAQTRQRGSELDKPQGGTTGVTLAGPP